MKKSGKIAAYTTGEKARIASGPKVALRQDITVISYWGAVTIAQVAMFYGMLIKLITRVQHAKKYSTAAVERCEGHPSKGRWRVVPPPLP